MTTFSNFSVGAQFAGDIARLSTGERTIHGSDPAGASVADSMRSQARSAAVAARNSENGISSYICTYSDGISYFKHQIKRTCSSKN